MSDAFAPATAGRWRIPMHARSPEEEHRAATPLELFFDLVFVVAIAHAGGELHHAIADGHAGAGIISYLLVFFAIWWAWMNFTWFASAYDTDDIAYRLVVFVQLTGALILAAGVARAFETRDFGVCIIGYVVMRLGLVGQWLRAAHADPERRGCALRYAIGVGAVQVAWIVLYLTRGGAWVPGFLVLAAAELLVPAWAERYGRTTWHPEHIAERYGLFTIIVLGESILAATTAIQVAAAEGGLDAHLLEITAGGLLIVLAMWWVYFDRPASRLLTSLPRAFLWGYGHFFIFAAAAAVGAGLAVEVDHATHHADIGEITAGAAVAVPVALYVLCLWGLHQLPRDDEAASKSAAPFAALLILASPFTGHAVLVTGLVMAALLAQKLVVRARATAHASG